MGMIDPSARIDAGAVVGQDASIGPFCVIGPNVVVGAGCRLLAHVHLSGHTTIGARTVVYPFASLGTPPQSVRYRGGETRLVVGADCDIREGVTVNTGTEDGGGVTAVGDRCFLMAGSHVGHDCQVGSEVTFANNAVLGGHVTIGDRTVLGGQAAVHQFVRVGEGAMLGGVSGIACDVIPFGFAFGQRATLVGLNMIGLKRSGHSRAELHQLRQGFRALFLGEGRFRDRLEAVAVKYAAVPLISKILDFVRKGGSRPIMMPPQVRGGEGPEAAAMHE
jgi:UDP-N-acetylglucosamine acyltransferase